MQLNAYLGNRRHHPGNTVERRQRSETAVHRMAVLDRALLRLACFEIRSGLAPSIAISEAVELANELSTEDSGRFINGVLGRIAREREGAASP